MADDQPGSQRTRLAEDRTVLAAERTFAAWLRTGLAFLATGLAAQRFLHDVLPAWELRVLAMTLVMSALACFGACGWRDWRVRTRLSEAEIQLMPQILMLGIVVLLTIVSLLAVGALWVM